MLDKEQLFFVGLLNDYINGQISTEKDIDWDKLFSLSKKHDLVGIIYYQCRLFCKDQRFRSEYYQSIQGYTKKTILEQNIENAFKANGIGYFLLKGKTIGLYYPTPMLRTASDTDIVVLDREASYRIMMDLGFHCISKIDNRDWQYERQGNVVELHDHLANPSSVIPPNMEEYFNHFQPYIRNDMLDPSFHFLFILFHLLKHFVGSGVGIRQFLDVAIMTKYCTMLNWKWIEHELRTINLFSFAQKVFAFNQYWFGISSPINISTEELEGEFFQEAIEEILLNGVFGAGNADNSNYLIANKARNSVCPKWVMISTAISQIFPPYRSMKQIPQYAFVSGKPYLLPFAWIYRIGLKLFYGRIIEGKSAIRSSFVSIDTIMKRKKRFKEWGIESIDNSSI